MLKFQILATLKKEKKTKFIFGIKMLYENTCNKLKIYRLIGNEGYGD